MHRSQIQHQLNILSIVVAECPEMIPVLFRQMAEVCKEKRIALLGRFAQAQDGGEYFKWSEMQNCLNESAEMIEHSILKKSTDSSTLNS